MRWLLYPIEKTRFRPDRCCPAADCQRQGSDTAIVFTVAVIVVAAPLPKSSPSQHISYVGGRSGPLIDGYDGCAAKTEVVLQSQPRSVDLARVGPPT